MFNALSLLAIAALLFTSFALLALTQERHWETVSGSKAPFVQYKWAQRAIFLIAIFCVLPLNVALEGAGFGSLLWLLMVCASAGAVALTLTVCPAVLHPLARIMAKASCIFEPE